MFLLKAASFVIKRCDEFILLGLSMVILGDTYSYYIPARIMFSIIFAVAKFKVNVFLCFSHNSNSRGSETITRVVSSNLKTGQAKEQQSRKILFSKGKSHTHTHTHTHTHQR